MLVFLEQSLQQRRVPWIRAILKTQKQKVFARVDESGALLAQNGRVEIRYNPKDGRFYEARAGNLEPIADSPVVSDEAMGIAVRVSQSAPAQGSLGSNSSTNTPNSIPAGRPGVSNSMKMGTKSAELLKIAQEQKAQAQNGSPSNKLAPHRAISPGVVVAYADGACSGNPGPAGFGIVVLDGKKRIEISEYLGQGTNNIAELSAVLRALAEVPDKGRPLVIWTDSQYSIGILQKGWKAKANVELIEQLKQALRARPADIRYVPGHSGIALNERADELAREAIIKKHSRRAELFEEEGI